MSLQHTRCAARRLDTVLAYITARSPQGAGYVMDRLQDMIALCRDHPRSGTATGKRNIRRIVSDPYPDLIFDRATRDKIVIHGVRHTARRPRV